MSTYSLINNGDSGLNARTKINNIITEVNNLPQFFSATASTTTTSSVEALSIPMTGYNAALIKIDALGYDESENAIGVTGFFVFKLFEGGLEPVSTPDLYLKTDFSTATLDVTATNDESIEIYVVGELNNPINWVLSGSVLKYN